MYGTGRKTVLSPRDKAVRTGKPGILLFACLFLFQGLSAQAQSLNDGSIYSRFGIGERQLFNSSKAQAMGGGGYALSSTIYANFANPASLSDQFYTRFAGGLTYETISASADGFETGRLASGSLSGIQIALPLKVNRTGIGISFSPYTRVSYRVVGNSELTSDPENATSTPLVTRFNGNGGLYKLSIAAGHRLNSRFSFGLSTDLLFGILEETQGATFNSTQFVDRTVESSTRLNGIAATFGARWLVPGLKNGRSLVVGATATIPASLSGERALALTTAVGRDTLGTTTKGDMDLPLSVGVGFAFQPNPRWSLIADVTYEGWSSFKSDFSLPGYDSSGSTFDDRIRISAGAEYWPAAGRNFATYGSRIAYRFGVYSDKSYVSPVTSESINSVGMTTGLSLPSLIPGTTIDFNFDVGRRGTTSNGLVRDRYVRFGLNINFGERWFDRLPRS